MPILHAMLPLYDVTHVYFAYVTGYQGTQFSSMCYFRYIPFTSCVLFSLYLVHLKQLDYRHSFGLYNIYVDILHMAGLIYHSAISSNCFLRFHCSDAVPSDQNVVLQSKIGVL
jgi:hypothetical protein